MDPAQQHHVINDPRLQEPDVDVVKLLPSGNLVFYCPGCKDLHLVDAARWNWNKNTIQPTLSPSVLHFIERQGGARQTICHYFIEAGVIKYCGDCPHDLADQQVVMEVVGPKLVDWK